MRGEEHHFQHVIAAERIVGVGNIILAETDIDALGEQLAGVKANIQGIYNKPAA